MIDLCLSRLKDKSTTSDSKFYYFFINRAKQV